MITQQAIEAVQNAADNLLGAGFKACPIVGTPLADLVSRSQNVATVGTSIPLERLVEATSIPLSEGGPSAHDVFMEKTVEVAGKVVTNSFELTRNVITPLVKQLIENYEATLGGLVYDVLPPARILPNIWSSIWSSTLLAEMVAKFKDVPLELRPFGVKMPEMTASQIRAMLKTRISLLDASIEKWFDDLPEDFVHETWTQVFVYQNIAIGRRTNSKFSLDSTTLNRDSILLVYFISKGMEQALPDGLNVSLDALRKELVHLQNQAARAVAQELAFRETIQRSNLLVAYVNKTPNKDGSTTYDVVVNNDVYLKFLSDPMGSAEAILGSAASGDGVYMYSALLENKVKYENFWAKALGVHNQKIAANRFTFQRDSLRLTFNRYINSQDEANLPAVRAYLHERAASFINKLEPRDVVDPVVCIRDLVCCILFADSNAGQFYKSFDQVELENPNINTRECALYATIDLVSRWLASQILRKSASEKTEVPEDGRYLTVCTLSNAITLGVKIIQSIAGNEISDSTGGKFVDTDELRVTFTAKLNSYVHVEHSTK
jgi:hypothetical protein